MKVKCIDNLACKLEIGKIYTVVSESVHHYVLAESDVACIFYDKGRFEIMPEVAAALSPIRTLVSDLYYAVDKNADSGWLYKKLPHRGSFDKEIANPENYESWIFADTDDAFACESIHNYELQAEDMPIS